MEPIDSVHSVVSAFVETLDQDGRGAVRLPVYYLNLVVDEIAGRIRPPPRLTGGVYTAMPRFLVLSFSDTLFTVTRTARASLAFTVARDGRIGDLGLWGTTFNASLESSVMQAIVATDSARVIPPLPSELRRDRLRMRLVVEPERFWDQPVLGAYASRSDLRPVFRLVRPVFRVSSLAARPHLSAPEADHAPAPPPPTLDFVISDSGEIVAGTMTLSRSANPDVAELFMRSVAALSFSPTRSGSCALPSFVQLPIVLPSR